MAAKSVDIGRDESFERVCSGIWTNIMTNIYVVGFFSLAHSISIYVALLLLAKECTFH